MQGGHSDPQALGSNTKHPQPATGSGGLCCMKSWLFLVPGAHPSCQGGCHSSTPAHFIPITGRLWGARKRTHSLLFLGSEEGCGGAKGPPCQCQGLPKPEWESDWGSLRSKAEERDYFSQEPSSSFGRGPRDPGAQGLGGKGLSNKLSTPTVFNMPTHRPPGVCSVELGGKPAQCLRSE